MSKKKREHIVFDNMRRIKKNIPFYKVNSIYRKNENYECIKISNSK